MKNNKTLKLSVFILVIFSFAFFSFTDYGKYTMVNEKVIRNSNGALYMKGQVIIKFKSQIFTYTNKTFGIEKIDQILQQYDVESVWQRFPLKKDFKKWTIGDEDLAKVFTIEYKGTIDPIELSDMIKEQNSDIIMFAEPNLVYVSDYIPNDPNVSQQYHISRINAYQGWDLNRGDTNVVIGIVDSGSDLDHPDLHANIKINYAENPTNNIDDDNNGYIDDWIGWDFIGGGTGQDNDPQIYGSNCDHGSHVSGCASQVTDNNVHGAGVGFKVKLLISKHGNDNDYSGPGGSSLIYNSDMGIVYCYQNGAKVMNCSYGSGYASGYTQNLVTNAWNAGCMVVASAGNDGVNTPRYPASYTNVISVAATGQTDVKASWSNYHWSVDLCAPGESILSTLWNNGYASLDGTSMSSPIAAGHVALVRSKYNTWTPQQVLDRVLEGVDSIYGIQGNQNYIGMLGTGRINTFKSLSDNPIISVISVAHNDSIYGNNDKVYDVDEVIPIAVTYKNIWISGNNISLRLTTTDPDVEIVQDSVFVGNIPAYVQGSTSFNNTFRVKAKSTCTFDKDVTFKLANSNTAYTNNASNTFVIRFRQGFAVHNINNLKLCLTKDGAIGKKTQAYGSGLLLGSGTTNNINEGGLMIGISNTKVSDVCRKGSVPANASDTDFVALTTYSMTTPGTASGQDGKGLFNDNGAGADKIGVEVKQESYAFSTTPDMNYILIKYSIKNTNTTQLSNLFVGQYIFFSPNGGYTNSISALDTLNKLGYTYNSTTPDPSLGSAIMTNHNLNFKALNLTEVLNGFTTQEKWDALSNGISVPQLGPGANCFCISAGPISIPAGETEKIGFAILKASDVSSLKSLVNVAKAKYQTVFVNTISDIIPEKYELMQNYPNPFNPVTNIKYGLKEKGFVSIKVFDLLGREIAVLVNEYQNAGYYQVIFDISNFALSSGTYFYRIESNNFIDVKKMTIIK